jgi:hypothetical protein
MGVIGAKRLLVRLRLIHLFDFAPPGLFEPQLERDVETEDRIPALAGNGLGPVGILACRRLRVRSKGRPSRR